MEPTETIISTEASLVKPEVNERIDALEVALLQEFTQIDCPLNHTFLDGQYMREIFMPAGSKVTSKIHKFRHPFFVMKGKVKVWTQESGWQLIQAPYAGITERGTRRVLDVIEDTYWVTVHANPSDTENLEVIEDLIIEKHANPFLSQQNEIE